MTTTITVPDCGIYSFPLPHPEDLPFSSVLVGGNQAVLKRVTEKVTHVSGTAVPGSVLLVEPSVAPSTANRMFVDGIRVQVGNQTMGCGNKYHTTYVTRNGIRISIWIEHYTDSALIYVEAANAECDKDQTWGPRTIPEVELQFRGSTVARFDFSGKRLNPREHTCRIAAIGPQRQALLGMEHRIQCEGELSYQTIPAWGPQEIVIPNPVLDIPSMPMIGATPDESPLRPMGMPSGNDTGGHLIEPVLLPATNAQGISWLVEVALRTMDREPLWAYLPDGDACSDDNMVDLYGGTLPYRLADTNLNIYGDPSADGRIRSQAMPEFHVAQWAPDAEARVHHEYKPHDGQHFVRATSPLKSLVWNACDPYAMHCIRMLGAHGTLVRTSNECRDVRWGYANSVYDMLCRQPEEKKGLGMGVGRREDAWMTEIILMDFVVNDSTDSWEWLLDNHKVIKQNLLPSGLGSQKGNNVVRNYALHYPANGDFRLIDFDRGVHFCQTFEAEHYTHVLYCLSRIPEFAELEQDVVNASKLIGSAHYDVGGGRKAPCWYIEIADENGVAYEFVPAGQGSYAENWYGMVVHSYAHSINPEGPHIEFLKELYGPDIDDFPNCQKYELGRAQTLGLLDLDTTTVIDPPDQTTVERIAELEAMLVDCNGQISDMENELVLIRNQLDANQVELVATRSTQERWRVAMNNAISDEIAATAKYDNLLERARNLFRNLS